MRFMGTVYTSPVSPNSASETRIPIVAFFLVGIEILALISNMTGSCRNALSSSSLRGTAGSLTFFVSPRESSPRWPTPSSGGYDSSVGAEPPLEPTGRNVVLFRGRLRCPPPGTLTMKKLAPRPLVLLSFLGAMLLCPWASAAEPTPPRAGLTQPRSGQTQRFGSGTLTNRSDGTSSQTRPFGSGSITTERTRDGRTITGQTQKFGSGTITNRSDGSSSQTQRFGSGTIQRDRQGRQCR